MNSPLHTILLGSVRITRRRRRVTVEFGYERDPKASSQTLVGDALRRAMAEMSLIVKELAPQPPRPAPETARHGVLSTEVV